MRDSPFLTKLLALLLAACFHNPAALAGAAVTVIVEPSGEPGEFTASASVRDAETGATIAAPRLALRAGAEATATLQTPGPEPSEVQFEVGVDATSTRARWRVEWRRGGRVEASAESTVTLAAPAESGY